MTAQQPIDLHRERQARRPLTGRYRGPSAALRGAHRELDQLRADAGRSLFVDSAEVIAVADELDRILAAVLDDRLTKLNNKAGAEQ